MIDEQFQKVVVRFLKLILQILWQIRLSDATAPSPEVKAGVASALKFKYTVKKAEVPRKP